MTPATSTPGCAVPLVLVAAALNAMALTAAALFAGWRGAVGLLLIEVAVSALAAAVFVRGIATAEDPQVIADAMAVRALAWARHDTAAGSAIGCGAPGESWDDHMAWHEAEARRELAPDR
jgi:hypothetical protein